jgi:hypothetical protein
MSTLTAAIVTATLAVTGAAGGPAAHASARVARAADAVAQAFPGGRVDRELGKVSAAAGDVGRAFEVGR